MDKIILTKALLQKPGAKIIRHFSVEFKKKIVRDLESKAISVTKVVNLYQVSSTAVYKWLYKYSKKYEKGTKMVLELESESARTEYLQKRVATLEQLLGQKQAEIEYYEKMLDLCSDELGYDVKKNFRTKQLNGLE